MKYVTVELHDLIHSINETSEISVNSEQIMPKSNKLKYRQYRQYSDYPNNNVYKLSILISFIIFGGFVLSMIRYFETDLWFSNPLSYSTQHQNQSLITIHAIQAVIWTVTASIQLILGSYLTRSSTISKSNFQNKLHRFIGKFILPINILLFLGSAALILLNEYIDGNTVHPTSIHLNIGACLFILLWSTLGFYYIFIDKQIDKHQDCMIATFIASSVSGLYRLVRYLFFIIYWLFISIDGNICDDVNVLPYIIVTGIFMAILSIFVLRNRLNWNNIHNVLYVAGYSVTLIYPLLTMDISFNPCHSINIDYRL